MLQAKTPEEAKRIIIESFKGSTPKTEVLPLAACSGRVLAESIVANEFVPGFDRSNVDGYALRAKDTLPGSPLLRLRGVVEMGRAPSFELEEGECAYVPTGGALPDGADAVAMLEHSESGGAGEIAILKPISAGSNIAFRGKDVYPGKVIMKKGRKISVEDIGALAALGICELKIAKKPLVGILSTGDELVDMSLSPGIGQVRDANSAMLAAAVQDYGAEPRLLGIIRDGYVALREAMLSALRECDILIILGGSSVGQMDSTCAVIDKNGRLLIHGIAMKPGKPTIVGDVEGKPVFGIPGNPLAAYFVCEYFVRSAINRLLGCEDSERYVIARLSENVKASRGRIQFCGGILENRDSGLWVKPSNSRSGLISALSDCGGYFLVSEECCSEGDEVKVFLK